MGCNFVESMLETFRLFIRIKIMESSRVVTKSFKQYEFKHLIERPANVEIGIIKICEDGNGRVYLGVSSTFGDTLSSSLLYFDEQENKVKKFLTPDSIKIQNVFNLINDKNGNVYIYSYTGFFKIDTDRKISRVLAPIKELENNNYSKFSRKSSELHQRALLVSYYFFCVKLDQR